MSHLKKVAEAQRVVWKLIVAGGVLIIVGILLFLVLGTLDNAAFIAGQSRRTTSKLPIIGVVVLVIGIGVLVYGFVRGMKYGFTADNRHSEASATGIFILGKHAISREGDPIFDADLADPDRDYFLVLVALSAGTKIEMKTSYELYESLGEGTYGDILYQGTWLSQFTMRPRPDRGY